MTKHLWFRRKHIRSTWSCFQFTVEDTRPDDSMPFLDTLLMPEPDKTVSITTYRNPTHTNQYLHWYNHNNFAATYSVFHTLTHRSRTLHSNPQSLQKEEHTSEVLQRCKYPIWPFNKMEIKSNQKKPTYITNNKNKQDLPKRNNTHGTYKRAE